MSRRGLPVSAHSSTNGWDPDTLKREILFTSRIGARILVVHPEALGFDVSRPNAEPNKIRNLGDLAKKRGLFLAIENDRKGMLPLQRARDAIGCDPLKTGIGVCIDTGHANIAYSRDKRHILEYFEEFKTMIVEVHISDNDGLEDRHLLPGEGTISWQDIFSAICSLPEEVLLCLELASARNPLRAIRRATDFVICGLQEW